MYLRCSLGLLALFLAGTLMQPAVWAQEWQALFDGRTLGNWAPTKFGGEGDVFVQDGSMVLTHGTDMTGITWQGPFPTRNYEVSLEAKRTWGIDFFCGMTFPVDDAFCSLIVGGWAGSVVGISSINGMDASENETTRVMGFENDRWYRIRLRVSQGKIQAWIDEQQVVDLETAGAQLWIRPEMDLSRPFGFATWQTTGVLRDIRMRKLPD